MPPHSRIVLRYQRGKWPSLQASAKLARLNGPCGNREAMSATPAEPGRRLATAIHANGVAQSTAAAMSNSRMIMAGGWEWAWDWERNWEWELEWRWEWERNWESFSPSPCGRGGGGGGGSGVPPAPALPPPPPPPTL